MSTSNISSLNELLSLYPRQEKEPSKEDKMKTRMQIFDKEEVNKRNCEFDYIERGIFDV